MKILNYVKTLKRKLAPRLVIDRTVLDEQIASLMKLNTTLANDRERLLKERAEILSKMNASERESISSAEIVEPENTYQFMGYKIPINLMLMTGGGPETFDIISGGHIRNLQRWIGIEANHTVLEIGCGIGRDAIPLTQILLNGRYVGIDIIGPSIKWCSENIAAKHCNFEFHHFDVEDQIHNSDGTTRTADIVLPIGDRSVDRIILFSVFTHLTRVDIEHYLTEFRRVLKPGGLVYATTFIYNDEILRSARSTNLTPFDLRFEHELEPGCRINDPNFPLGAVAYTKDAWDKMIENAGMCYTQDVLEGGWSGFYSDPKDGQDVVILTSR